ncbi:unnamed protein product [Pedinophyceae sp. YPF-701]|nr:unnamed protein product [Pedinophyceae sp. YPF-701]
MIAITAGRNQAGRFSTDLPPAGQGRWRQPRSTAGNAATASGHEEPRGTFRTDESSRNGAREAGDGRREDVLLFLRAGNHVRRAVWARHSGWFGLLRLFVAEFNLSVTDNVVSTDFYLQHPAFGTFYEGFSLDDLVPGSSVELRTEETGRLGQRDTEQYRTYERTRALELMRQEEQQRQLERHLMSKRQLMLARRSDSGAEGDGVSARDSLDGGDSKTDDDEKGKDGAEEDPEDAWRARWGAQWRNPLWLMLDDPASSSAARWLTIFIMLFIVISTITFCLETFPQFKEESEQRTSPLYLLEAVSIAIFTVEIFLRLLTTPSVPDYFRKLMNWIDIVSVLPFYIDLALNGTDIPGMQGLRVVRLVRVFRLFKMSQGTLALFGKTMQKSSRPLYMLIFFVSLGTVLFSSLIYYAERGKYDAEMRMWKRRFAYQCDITVQLAGSEPLDEAYIRARLSHCVLTNRISAQAAEFACEYQYRRNDSCFELFEPSPFTSIPASFWWCIVTMVTVGYGDVVPRYWYGKAIASLVMLFGVLVIALPITVIGSNFSNLYRKMVLAGKGPRGNVMLLQSIATLRAQEEKADEEEAQALAEMATRLGASGHTGTRSHMSGESERSLQSKQKSSGAMKRSIKEDLEGEEEAGRTAADSVGRNGGAPSLPPVVSEGGT